MKKKLSILLVLAMSVMALSACGDNEATTESGTDNSTESSAELAVFTPSVEVVKVLGNELDLAKLPVEEYVTLGEYKGVELEVAAKAEITEEDIDTAMLGYYFQHGDYYLTAEDFAAEGTVEDTDFVLIDYEGKKDGVAFEGGTAEDAILGIGSASFIDGFEAGLVGVTVGETVDLNLTFPEAYHSEELAGQDVVFTVTVKGIVKFVDDTVKKFMVPDVDTVEAYRDAVKNILTYDAESAYYTGLSDAIHAKLLEVCSVNKIPKSVFEMQKLYAKQQIEYEASYYGMDGENYAAVMAGMSLDDYAASLAENVTMNSVLFQAIANAENLEVTKEELDGFVEEYISLYGESQGISTPEEFFELSSENEVKLVLLQEEVINFMTENSTIVEK